MGNTIGQLLPPEAKFTEKTLPDQTGNVFIVTGSSSGVGKELAQILYSHNAKVYIAARSSEKSSVTIESIGTAFPESKGELVFLHLDLDDLTTIKKSADDFLSKEKRLDVLWNNAGVMFPPQGSKTKQGYELQLGTNNVAPFLFTKLLTPILIKTAKASSPGDGGLEMDNLDYKTDKAPWHKYGVSKAGNVYHAKEYAKRHGHTGITSVSLNPGNLRTELQRYIPGWQLMLFKLMLYTPIHGAYTELFAGISPEVKPENNGAWIIPWGRLTSLRKDIEEGSKTEAEGGTGIGAAFWEWSEEQVKPDL